MNGFSPDFLKRLKPYQRAELCAALEAQAQHQARAGLLAFARYTKENYAAGWHHEILCDKLDRFARGEIKRLIVSMPPRHGKSELVSRRLPAFIYGLNPDAQIIACSYGADLASRMNRDVQRIMEGEAYRRLFPGTRLGGENVRTTAEGAVLKNSDIFEIVGHRGVYRCAGTGGGITGMGADFIIIDDPIKDGEQAMSPTYREKVWEWYQSTLYSRLETQNGGEDGGILVTMTRWHEDDLVGRLLAQAKADPDADQWEVLELPAICELEGSCAIDPRKTGEALWEEKYPLPKLERLRRAIGPQWWNSLYQQRPSAMEGGIIKRSWIKFYRKSELPETFQEELQSWDCTFKETKSSDFVVGQVWGRKGANKYLLDQVRDRMDFTKTIAALLSMSARHPRTYTKLVEDKANGPAVIATLKNSVSGLVAVEPEGSKEARLSAVAVEFEAGNVLLPHPDEAPWVRDFIEELVNFPNAAHDDQADACSQALWRLRDMASFTAEMIPGRIRSITSGLTSAGVRR